MKIIKRVPWLIPVNNLAGPAPRSRGRQLIPPQWRDRLREATVLHPKVKGPCKLDMRFCLSPDWFTAKHVSGPDTAKLADSVMAVLRKTIFSDNPDGDGAVIWLILQKLRDDESTESELMMILEELPAKVVTVKGAAEVYLKPLSLRLRKGIRKRVVGKTKAKS